MPSEARDFAFTTLTYPPYGISFDPAGTGVLAVAGGGGRARTGLKNIVSVYDLSISGPPTAIAEHHVPLGDDNPTVVALLRKSGYSTTTITSSSLLPVPPPGSLVTASLSTPDSQLTILSGVNSSEELCRQGINRHLRTFAVHSKEKGADGQQLESVGGLGTGPEAPLGVAKDGSNRGHNLGESGDLNPLDAGENQVLRSVNENVAGKSDRKKKNEIDPSTLPATIIPIGAAQFLSLPEKPADRLSTFQSILVLSKPGVGVPPPAGQIGAVASSLSGSGNELVVFNASVDSPNPNTGDLLAVCRMDKGVEMTDIDIIQTASEPGEPKLQSTASVFQILVCTSRAVQIGRVAYDFRTRAVVGPPLQLVPLFSTPLTGDVRSRDAIQAARFLTDKLVAVFFSTADRKQSKLAILKISWNTGSAASGAAGEIDNVDLVLQKRLPASLGGWLKCDVLRLGEDPVTGESQVVIAGGFGTRKMAVFTVDLRHGQLVGGGVRMVKTISDFHADAITGLALSPVAARGSSSGGSDGGSGGGVGPVAVLRLASCSLARTLAVHVLPLTTIPCRKRPISADITNDSSSPSSSSYKTNQQHQAQNEPGYRYILRPQSSFLNSPTSVGGSILLFIMTFGVLLVALFMGGDVASSLPAAFSDSPALGRFIEPIEHLQAYVQGRAAGSRRDSLLSSSSILSSPSAVIRASPVAMVAKNAEHSTAADENESDGEDEGYWPLSVRMLNSLSKHHREENQDRENEACDGGSEHLGEGKGSGCSKEHFLYRRRNLHVPGSPAFRNQLEKEKQGSGAEGDSDKEHDGGHGQGQGQGRQQKAVEGGQDADSGRRDYAEEVRKMLENAPEGSFFLVRGSPVGLGGVAGMGGSAGEKPPVPVGSVIPDEEIDREGESGGARSVGARTVAAEPEPEPTPAVAEGEESGVGRRWASLPDADKDLWKRRLLKSGMWREEDGEGVLDRIVIGA